MHSLGKAPLFIMRCLSLHHTLTLQSWKWQENDAFLYKVKTFRLPSSRRQQIPLAEESTWMDISRSGTFGVK